MSDPSGISSIAGNPAAQTGGKGQVVQIVSLPESLENNARAIRLQGEVVRQNENGSVRVRTPEGDIDINVRGRQPQQGQRIEVDIPPGNPPKQATIRPAPAQAQAPQPQPQQPPTQTQPAPLPQTPVTRPATPPPVTSGTTQPLPPQTGAEKPAAAPPAQDTYQPAPSKPATPAAPLPPLSPGQTVKLVPYSSLQTTPTSGPATQNQSTMPNMSPGTDIIQGAAAKANIIAAKGEGTLITTLLNAVKSALPQSLTPQTLKTNPALQQSSTMPLFQDIKPVPSATFAPMVLSAKITSLTLPSGQTLTMPPPASATPVTGAPASPQIQASTQTPSITVTVSDITPQQQPIIPIVMNDKGAVQNFILQSPPASVPVGTQVTFQPQAPQIATPATQGNTAPTTTPAIPQGMTLLPSSASQLPPAWRTLLPMMQPASVWPVMDELFQTFYQTTPQAAQILGRTLPSPANPSNFGPAVMLFAAALKSGQIQTWLGERKLDMVQKLGKDSLISRLSGESSSIPQNTDASATDWKSFPVPMLWQNEISKVLFHVRKEPSEDGRESEDGATRFVMDLSLTRMGDVQIDGLVRGKQLDLIVRTQMAVSYSMQDAMRVAYAKALDGTDIYGDIGFQSGKDRWENILQRQENITASV